ncbi:MAG TPA: hypothetical protein VGQ08_18355 [Nitrospiraceae bacterium]|jgi:hypothetical protein|nr:hypothetical protein [Nitrospiraceae bacterium]
MSTDRPTVKSMSIEEATISNMWELAAIVEVLEGKGLCTSKTSTPSSTSCAGKPPCANP